MAQQMAEVSQAPFATTGRYYAPYTSSAGGPDESAPLASHDPSGPSLVNRRPIPEQPPSFPPRPLQESTTAVTTGSNLNGTAGDYPRPPVRNPQTLGNDPFPRPPVRHGTIWENEDSTNTIPYFRDPTKVIVYLIPFPKPNFAKNEYKAVPDRFLLYTPIPPPLRKPEKRRDGAREGKRHKVQRKWQGEVRKAKKDDSRLASWKGLRFRAAKLVDYGITWVTNTNIDLLNRVPPRGKKPKKNKKNQPPRPGPAEGSYDPNGGLQEMILVYPPSLPGTPDQLREEFIATLLRSKKKAYRDSIIATGLLPVTLAIDTFAAVFWPFGGLFEIDLVWLYNSARGAKVARSVLNRLNNKDPNMNIKLTFVPSQRVDVMQNYLQASCFKKDRNMFTKENAASIPTETQVLEAIGWTPSEQARQAKMTAQEQTPPFPTSPPPHVGANPSPGQWQASGLESGTGPDTGFGRTATPARWTGTGTAGASTGTINGSGSDFGSSAHLNPGGTGVASAPPSSETPAAARRNWDDEQWEISEAKDDLKWAVKKGAKEWRRWCKRFRRNPMRAVGK